MEYYNCEYIELEYYTSKYFYLKHNTFTNYKPAYVLYFYFKPKQSGI